MKTFRCDLCGVECLPGQEIKFHKRPEKPLFGYFFLSRIAEEVGVGMANNANADLCSTKPLDLCPKCERDTYDAIVKMVSRPKDNK